MAHPVYVHTANTATHTVLGQWQGAWQTTRPHRDRAVTSATSCTDDTVTQTMTTTVSSMHSIGCRTLDVTMLLK